jgi:hypothetical protein
VCHRPQTAALAPGPAATWRWILVKVADSGARPGSDIVAEQPASVRSGKTWNQLREDEQITAPGR